MAGQTKQSPSGLTRTRVANQLSGKYIGRYTARVPGGGRIVVELADGKKWLLVKRRNERTGTALWAGTVLITGVPSLDFDVRVSLVLDDRGKAQLVDSLELHRRKGSPQINARSGRQAGLGQVIRYARRALSVPVDESGRVGYPSKEMWYSTSGLEGGTAKDYEGLVLSAGRPQSQSEPRVGHDEYAAAVVAYREAKKRGLPTTLAVAGKLGCSESVARQRIFKARKLKLLPAAGGTTRP